MSDIPPLVIPRHLRPSSRIPLIGLAVITLGTAGFAYWQHRQVAKVSAFAESMRQELRAAREEAEALQEQKNALEVQKQELERAKAELTKRLQAKPQEATETAGQKVLASADRTKAPAPEAKASAKRKHTKKVAKTSSSKSRKHKKR